MKRHELMDLLPKDQLERVFQYEMCDIDPEFMGFTEQYKALATIIPKNRIIFDFGCAYAPQCYYFKDHQRYIGVDRWRGDPRFHMNNTLHYEMSIQQFIRDELPILSRVYDMRNAFAICNYVPDDEATALVRATFPNVFTFYPYKEDDEL